MILDLRSTLEDLTDHARTFTGPDVHVRLGPIPVTAHSDHQAFLDQVRDHDLGLSRPAPWRPLSTYLMSNTGLDARHIPPSLRPSGEPGPITVLRDESWIAVSDTHLLHVVDMERGTALRWSRDIADVPIWETGKPLRFALRAWSTVNNAAMLHAAAVAGSQGATLLVGPGGTGKSTTAFACLGHGLDLLADDYCIAEMVGTDEVVVHPTYLIGNLDERSLDLLPHLTSRVTGIGPKNKRLVPLDPLPVASHRVPLRHICTIERRPGETTRLEPVTRAEALKLVAPSSVLQIPGLGKETWRITTQVVRSLQAHRLIVGDLEEVPGVLTGLLGRFPSC